MTLTGLVLLAAVAAGGYWLGGRRPDPNDHTNAPGQPAATGRRSWLGPVVAVVGIVLVLGWLAPGPGLLDGPGEIFGRGGIFDDPPGPAGPGGFLSGR